MFYSLLRIQRFFEALYQTLVSLLRILLRFRFRSDISRVYRQVQGSGQHDLIILANGPSLRSSLWNHKGVLRNKPLMVVNQFVLTDAYTELKPAYYLLLDIGFFLDRTIPRVMEVRKQLIQAFLEKTSWPLTLFFPAEGRNSEMHRELKASGLPFTFIFYNRTVADGLKPVRHWIYRRNLGMPPPQNVLIGALMVSLCSGFRDITMLGADHSWHLGLEVGSDGKLSSAEHHFYDPKPWKVAVHHPETLKQAAIHDYFFNLHRTFRSYHLIRIFADSLGASIINASEVTFIDAFERRDFATYPWGAGEER